MPDEKENPTSDQQRPHLILTYDPESHGFGFKVVGKIPHMELIGMLAVLQSMYEDAVKKQMATSMEGQMKKLNIVLPGGAIPRMRM